MASLTKAQLLDQLAALRLHADRVETELASKTAAYEEGLRIWGQLRAQHQSQPSRPAALNGEQVVGRYVRRDGAHIVKVRLANSNVIAHREVAA